MRLLDLYCGAGGCSVGYSWAGFSDIVGVDIFWFRHYPFKFVRGRVPLDPDGFHALISKIQPDCLHASPPCRAYSQASAFMGKEKYPNEIKQLRTRLQETGLPYVIENVQTAPLLRDQSILLCGTMFSQNVPMTKSGALRVLRHRLFESNMPLTAPKTHPKHPLVYTTKRAYPHYGRFDPYKDFVMVYGGGNAPAAAARDAMGIDWMNRDELSEAIPPVYTEFIGKQLLTSMPSI